jgi:hypothetical protein
MRMCTVSFTQLSGHQSIEQIINPAPARFRNVESGTALMIIIACDIIPVLFLMSPFSNTCEALLA